MFVLIEYIPDMEWEHVLGVLPSDKDADIVRALKKVSIHFPNHKRIDIVKNRSVDKLTSIQFFNALTQGGCTVQLRKTQLL